MSSKRRPALLFYTGDWKKDPQLSQCSPATRGIWVDLLCAMHDDDECGRLAGDEAALARIGRCTVAELRDCVAELKATKTATVTFRNGRVTLVNRRMSREHVERKANAARQKRYRNARSDGDRNADVTAMSHDPSTSSSSSSSKRNVTCEICEDGAVKDHRGMILRCCACPAGKARALRFAREKQLEEESAARRADETPRAPQPEAKHFDRPEGPSAIGDLLPDREETA